MGVYARYVFPRLMDLTMRPLEALRAETLASAAGEVLEIGFGTGLNLPHYPPGVRRLYAVDPLDSLRRTVEARIARAPFPVERLHLRADGRLPFENARFACVAMTWTLCSIAEPLAALQDIQRVLATGGSLLFIEHGRSDAPRVARWQRRLNPVQRRLAGGCQLDRPVAALIRKGGFELTKLDRFSLDGVPRIFGEMYRGIAWA